MILLIIMLLTEILMPVILKQHFFSNSKIRYYIIIVIHIILSLWLWFLFFETAGYNSFFDNPQHVWMLMNLNGMISAVVAPRVIISICHFTGKFIRRNSNEHINWLTNTGMIISAVVFTIITFSTLHGRFNFKTEEVTIKVKGLHQDLDGLRIVQLSDMHLAGFYHHRKVLVDVIDEVNAIKPDLILNTGDFVTYGWREFDRNDTILSKAISKYGNYAILGNHDFGTYHPFFTEADRSNNISILNNLVKASGYKVLNDENTEVRIGDARLVIIGIITMGRHPNIIHGDLNNAMNGIDSADLKILLSHDPNHWEEKVTGKTDIEITLSGHTHGMQMGILTKWFRWSPSKYFYPNWSGLYLHGQQVQYVNRGLGVLAIPFRIWMPPEITVITLKKE
jgi:predicted MPP superfamily phosphohydrolase